MKLEYSIIYSSKTGNTKILAEKIYNILPKEQCTYYGNIADIDETLSNILYIGFWTEKGTADLQTLTFLKNLKNKRRIILCQQLQQRSWRQYGLGLAEALLVIRFIQLSFHRQ